MTSLIERLIAAHRLLNREIQRELKRRIPDDFRLKQLKKRRLAVKDQLHRHISGEASIGNTARRALLRLRWAKPAIGRTGS